LLKHRSRSRASEVWPHGFNKMWWLLSRVIRSRREVIRIGGRREVVRSRREVARIGGRREVVRSRVIRSRREVIRR
jgi:hypothetical protein